MDNGVAVVIQKIERETQMQYCGVDYLEEGHSIYAAYEIDGDNDDLCFHGTYTENNELPEEYFGLNGCPLDEVADELLKLKKITDEEYWLVKNRYSI